MRFVGLSAAAIMLALLGCAQRSAPVRQRLSTLASLKRLSAADLWKRPATSAAMPQKGRDSTAATAPGTAAVLASTAVETKAESSQETIPAPPAEPLPIPNPAQEALSLSEAEWLAVTSSPIVRADADFFRADETIANARTKFDPDIARSGYLYGQRGVQAALADFDTRVVSRISANRNELIQNNRFLSGGILPGGTLEARGGGYETALQRINTFGGQSSLVNRWDYDASNREDLLYPSVFTGTLRAEYRQPLLAGFGRDYNLTAGPLIDSINGVTGVNQGVLIARNNTSIARINLDHVVAALIRDVRRLYWATVENREKLQLYGEVKAEIDRLLVQLRTVSKAQLAAGRLAELELEEISSQVDEEIHIAGQQLDEAFIRLRRLVGDDSLRGHEGLTDLPTCVPMAFEMEECQRIALASRGELRQRQLQIASARLQVRAAENLLRPRLDLTTGYWMNGFGDQLFGQGAPGPDRDTQVAIENLFQNDHTGWDVGLQYSQMPGRRLSFTRLRNHELQLRREVQLLREHEREVSLEVEAAIVQAEHALATLQLRAQQVSQQEEKIRLLQNQMAANWNPDLLTSLSRAYHSFAKSKALSMEACSQYENGKTEVIYRMGELLENASLRLESTP